MVIESNLRVASAGSLKTPQPMYRSERPGVKALFMYPSENQAARQIRLRAGLEDVTRSVTIRGIRYAFPLLERTVSPGEVIETNPSVHKVRAMSPLDRSLLDGVQSAEVTLTRGAGDCDDLALLYAYLLLQLGRDPNLEFGVLYGYLQLDTCDERFQSHALLAIRDRKRPNQYFFYDVSNLANGPVYSGSFSVGEQEFSYPTPVGYQSFIVNTYAPVAADGTLAKDLLVCFIR